MPEKNCTKKVVDWACKNPYFELFHAIDIIITEINQRNQSAMSKVHYSPLIVCYNEFSSGLTLIFDSIAGSFLDSFERRKASFMW